MLSNIEINNNALSLRKQFGEDFESIIDVISIIESQPDITLVYKNLGENIFGLASKTDKNKIIVINSLMSKGRQRFTAAHELCHLFFGKENSYVCNKNKHSQSISEEKEADLFASYFLAPFGSFRAKVIELTNIYKNIIEIVIRTEQYFQMSHLATLVRMLNEKFITQPDYEMLKSIHLGDYAKECGFDTSLYQPRKEKTDFTIGSYINLAIKLKNDDKISQEKFEELMLDAYREDIVYGEENDNAIND